VAGIVACRAALELVEQHRPATCTRLVSCFLVCSARGSEVPQRTADRILAQYGKHTDDALVLVARYVGQAS